MVAALLGDGKFLQRPNKSSKFRSDFAAAKEASQRIHMGGKYVCAHVRCQVIMAEELRCSWKNVTGCNDESLTQVIDDRQRSPPVTAYILEYAADIIAVFRGNFAAFEHLATEGV
jgi:hypothetical protein